MYAIPNPPHPEDIDWLEDSYSKSAERLLEIVAADPDDILEMVLELYAGESTADEFQERVTAHIDEIRHEWANQGEGL